MKKKKTLLKIAYLGLFLAFAMILSYVETLLPVFPYAPGVKLGLANCFILLILYIYGVREAAIINLSRIILCALLFTGFYAMLYSLAGGVFSLAIMAVSYRRKKIFSPIGVGMSGGAFHHIGQVLAAFFTTHNPVVFGYLPVLIVAGLFTGALVGFLVKLLYPKIKKLTDRAES